MDLGIKDKVALVLASSKGLGKAVAMELAKEGAKVIICGTDAVALARAIVDLAQDAPLRERLATAARNRIGEEFSLDQMLDGYSRICGI